MSQQQSTLDRKKKNFIFSRKFPFVKSREDQSEDGGSDQERKIILKSGFIRDCILNILLL